MKIKVVGSAIDRVQQRQFAASYVIDECVAIDAGCLGMISDVNEQRRIKHVFLSHSHLDHIATLPIFLDNVYRQGPDCPTIHATDTVRECLLRHLFNNVVWPDLISLAREESPFLNFRRLAPEATTVVEHLRITPIDLHHVVPTVGFIVEDAHSAVAIVSDTGPTSRIWEVAGALPQLRVLFLEAAFPNSMAWLAEKAGHLTPATFLTEYRKLGSNVPVVAVHLKAAFHDEVVRDLQALDLPQLSISEPNRVYEFLP